MMLNVDMMSMIQEHVAHNDPFNSYAIVVVWCIDLRYSTLIPFVVS